MASPTYEEMARVFGEVRGLEIVVQTLLAMQLAAQVKDEAGFAKAAETAEALRARLQTYVTQLLSALATGDPGMVEAHRAGMTGVVDRCFRSAGTQMEQISKVVLEVTEAASDAKH